MKRLQQAALLTALDERLHQEGSWCGETHLQKATYVLQEVCAVPLGFEFTLYKRGPFSFDLRDALTAMRADGLVEVVPQPYPYGPSLRVTQPGVELQRRFERTVGKYRHELDTVAAVTDRKTAAELERLATAIWVRLNNDTADADAMAQELHGLKPHIPLEDARAAIDEADRIVRDRAVTRG